jgi:hypothetical protein
MKKNLSDKLLEGKIIKKASLDKMLTFDSYLHKIILDLLIDSKKFWDNPLYQEVIRKDRFQNTIPISDATIKYVSIYLGAVYWRKERQLDQVHEETN